MSPYPTVVVVAVDQYIDTTYWYAMLKLAEIKRQNEAIASLYSSTDSTQSVTLTNKKPRS